MTALLSQIIAMLQSFIGAVNDYMNMTSASQGTLSKFIQILNQILTYNNLTFILTPILHMVALSVIFVIVDIMRDLL